MRFSHTHATRPFGRIPRGTLVAALVAVGLSGAGAAGAAIVHAPSSPAADELAMRCELRNPGPFAACDTEYQGPYGGTKAP
jgi:hypothetical protein